MTERQIIEMLRQKLAGGTKRGLAKRIGVTPQHLHDVFIGRRSPGPKILEFLNIEKRETFVQVRNG